MGVYELCDSCRHLTTAQWTMVDEDAPVDDELREGKSFWIVEQDGSEDGTQDEGGAGAGSEGNGGGDGDSYGSQANGHRDGSSDVDGHLNGYANGQSGGDGGGGGNSSNGSSNGSSSSSSSSIPEIFHPTESAEDLTPDSIEPFSHHNLYDMLSAPDTRCHLCRWIVDNLSTHAHKYLPEESDHLFAIPFLGSESIIDPATKSLAFYYFWDDSRSLESVFAIYLYLKPLKDAKNPPLITPAVPLRPSTTAAIRKWSNDCATNHDRCNALRLKLADELPTPGLPTRLLEISNRNHRPFVRLCDSSKLQPNVRYATLSHCWGVDSRLKLLQANRGDLYERIPFAALPQLFADAVKVSLSLGLTYLWIDALCIIQDSAEDWAAECASMAWVYSQAYVNLAGSASVDTRGSLFCQDDELLANSVVLRTEWPGSGLGSKAWLCFDESRWYRYVERAPLNRRAWVMQERLLAPRTVHFARDQVWWTCKRAQCGESLPAPLAGNLAAGPVADHFNRGNWEAMVEAYTSAEMTYARDRLVGLSGIAWAFQVTHGYPPGQYIAGLWAQNLQMQLLWKTRGGQSRVSKIYRAPSWSWASIDGGVEWDSSSAASAGRKRIWFAWGMRSWFDEHSDPYGAVVGARLRVDCMIYSVTVTRLGTRRYGGGGGGGGAGVGGGGGSSTSSSLALANSNVNGHGINGQPAPAPASPAHAHASTSVALNGVYGRSQTPTLGLSAVSPPIARPTPSWQPSPQHQRFMSLQDHSSSNSYGNGNGVSSMNGANGSHMPTNHNNNNGNSSNSSNSPIAQHTTYGSSNSNSSSINRFTTPYVVRSDNERFFGPAGAAMGGLARVSPDDDCFFAEQDGSGTSGDTMRAYFLPICVIDADPGSVSGHTPAMSAGSAAGMNGTGGGDGGGAGGRGGGGGGGGGQYPVVSGLLIKPVTAGPDTDRGTYRRVGRLDMTYYRNPSVWALYREWMAGETLKPLLYQKDHGGKRYDIVLV